MTAWDWPVMTAWDWLAYAIACDFLTMCGFRIGKGEAVFAPEEERQAARLRLLGGQS